MDEVIRFSNLAQENLTFSDEVLAAVGEPIKVQAEVVKGGSTSLSSFAIALAVTVTLMFITVLLAAGVLAGEREENAFGRLVRGLVSPTGLLAEKAGLAAVCSLLVAMLMLAGLGLFVELDWGRAPLWVLAGGVRGAGVRRAGPGDRRAGARGAGGLAARLHARPAACVPGPGALAGRWRPCSTT